MLQQARNLTDPDYGILKGKQFLIHDRDPLFTKLFKATLKGSGVRALKMPKQSPNLNAYAERFVWSIKYECLNKMIPLGEKHLAYVIDQYMEHYNQERPHQGLGNRRLSGTSAMAFPRDGPVRCRERLGGLLKTYFQKAA